MLEMTAQCQACGTTLVLPLPDEWQTPQGTVLDKDRIALEDNAARLHAMMEAMACPRCGQKTLRTVGMAEGRPEGVLPVYVQYVIPLERYVEVMADTMASAMTIVKQMIRDGQVPRPRYTEGLDDWTEITDLPHVHGHFRIDGEAI